jgi:hypothetical protein
VGCAAGSTIYEPDKGLCNISNLAKGAICMKILGSLYGWQVSAVDGRTCNVNGGAPISQSGGNIQGNSTSPSTDGYTYINCTAAAAGGVNDYAGFACW